MPDRIFVVEDDRDLRDLLVEVLHGAGHAPVPFDSGDAALRALHAGEPADLVLTDLVMAGAPGQEVLQQVRSTRPDVNVVVMTGFGSIDSAIDLVKQGAFDYLTKPLVTDALLLAVDRALEESRLRRDAGGSGAGGETPVGFVGTSAPMMRLYALIGRAGISRHPVLITGESGTGKELVARALHHRSERRAFVTVNCGALPEQLLESELFGHEKGAFTGADRAKEGLFETAHGGTLFLDEIAELPLALQPKLLRALELSEIRRVGATQSRTVDVRLVAATNRDLEREVEAGRFRDDLYWRLAVLLLHVPPLRERSEDVAPLATHFLRDATAGGPGRGAPGQRPERIGEEAMRTLHKYPWPGNVRELRNAIQRAATLSESAELQPDDLPPRIVQGGGAASVLAEGARRHLTLRELERLYILEVVHRAGGNKSKAAEQLGLDRKTLYRKLEEYRYEESSRRSVEGA